MCLRCRNVKHQLATCPLTSETQQADRSNLKQTNVGGNGPSVPARIYTLDQQQVPNSFEVGEGMISVSHHLVKILIDSGAIIPL